MLSHRSEGGEEEGSPVSQVGLFNDARRGVVATCPWEAEGSVLKHLGLWASDQNFRVSYKETFTAAPRKLLPSGRFLPKALCFYFSEPNKSYLTLSTQGEGVIPILINNAALIKHTWIH